MTFEDMYAQFKSIPDPLYSVCNDAVALGCYLVMKGQQEAGSRDEMLRREDEGITLATQPYINAGRKMINTAIDAAGLSRDVAYAVLENLPESIKALSAHHEMLLLFQVEKMR